MYREDSQVSRLARGEPTCERCGPDVREVTRLCEDMERRTRGWFSPRYAGGRGAGGWDPTGLVKGWATERAARVLASAARCDAVCVNGGGDIQLLGGPWRISARSWLEEQPDAEGLSTTASGATWQRSGFARWTA
ncbi:FAD:protein FMN transferase [Streptomyces sp. c-19]|uniref:FAD:protein FMN transferase n=1 Tax=Streptomyces sp. c-19 TaxID=2789275 RepID=UPI0039802573